MIARHLGYRSQSIVAVTWKSYQPDPRFCMCFRMSHRKNKADRHWLPASPQLQAFLADLKVRTKEYRAALQWSALGDARAAPEAVEQLPRQARSQGPDRSWADAARVARVSFAAEIKRVTGATDEQVAGALGDRDKRMGAHYTRHVEQENQVACAFFSLMTGTGTERDLENGRVQVFQTGNRTHQNARDFNDQ